MQREFLTGEHVYLRPIKKEDLNDVYRDWLNNEEVCHYNSHHRFPNYDENMHAYYDRVIKSHENLILAICDKKTDLHLGNIALENIDLINQSAEFAILIGDRSFWGKGVGKDAARAIIKHGFQQINLHRIYLGTSEDNVAMQKLAVSLGFVEEGRFRDAMYKNGAFRNTVHFGLLREEWKE